MRKRFLFYSLVMAGLYSCNSENKPDPVIRDTWVPIYTTNTSALKTVSAGPVRSTVNAGKIFTLGNIIYQVEQDSGIHVINYSNPSSPQKIGFIRSFLCKEVAVKSGLIYTNNFSDLVVIDASDLNNVREVARTANVFPDLALQYPPKPDPFSIIYFECPDPGKGIIVGWEKKSIANPKCRR